MSETDTETDADTGGASVELEPDVPMAHLRTIHAGCLSISTVTPADDEVKITEHLRACRCACMEAAVPVDMRMHAARNRRSPRYADKHPSGTTWGSRASGGDPASLG